MTVSGTCLSLKTIYIKCSVRANQCLKLNVVIPQRLGEPRLQHLPGRSQFSFLYAPFYCLHPREIRLSGDKMAVNLMAFICKFAKVLLLRIVNNNLGGESISFKN